LRQGHKQKHIAEQSDRSLDQQPVSDSEQSRIAFVHDDLICRVLLKPLAIQPRFARLGPQYSLFIVRIGAGNSGKFDSSCFSA
jgi:hypothetical protein